MSPVTYRIGAAFAIVGGVLGTLFFILHPQGEDDDETRAHLETVTDPLWPADHFGLLVGALFVLAGLVVFSRTIVGEPAATWAELGRYSAVVAVAISAAHLYAVDGQALHVLAEGYAGGGDEQVELTTAHAVEQLAVSMFGAVILTFGGVTQLLFGLAVALSPSHRSWPGWLAVALGIAGIVSATLLYFQEEFSGLAVLLFVIAMLGFNLWIVGQGIAMWRRARSAGADVERPAPATTVR